MSKYDDLVKKLKEIFQIDRPELDFGIYRILNARAGEINDYLENRLRARVGESLAASGAASMESLQKELKEKEAQYRADGIEPATVPKVRELRQKLADYSVGASEHENAVFSHLLTFFSRYYDSGDFISQRRYKGDTYAIPYAGEEVVLYWANKDQYYTKSGENFSNYAFKLDDGRSVRFRLVTADTAKDNRKDNDKERRFVLIEPLTRTLTDDEGDEYEETLQPVSEENGELVLRFEYKAMPKGNSGSKQDALVLDAVNKVLGDEIVKARWLDLNQREPTEKNPQRTLLEKHLTRYTTRNTADYFIHKDLGRFLRGELDFYIKNEVMYLDDVQNAEKFADIEKNLRLIQTLRAIALDLITFLAQLEDFQKKLWLKKKFVVATNYCITLDRVPDSLYPQIAANPRQWEQWDKLGMLDAATLSFFRGEAHNRHPIEDMPDAVAPSPLPGEAHNPGEVHNRHPVEGVPDAVAPSPLRGDTHNPGEVHNRHPIEGVPDAVAPSPLRGEGRGEGPGEKQTKSRTKEEHSKLLQTFAREMRQAPTDAEARMWHFLRDRRMAGLKFRRQHAIAKYIVDFICVDAGVVIELDGGQHADLLTQQADEERNAFLAERNLRVLRFWNNDVLQQTEAVLERILLELDAVTPHPSPLPEGEREQTSTSPEALSSPGRGLGEGLGEVQINYLKKHPYLMVDTALFDVTFKYALLASVENLDESLDGLLIHGDNFQALNLVGERFRRAVRAIYIDPPYNTDASPIVYKNAYQHSSWASLFSDRMSTAIQLLCDGGTVCVAIDDFEYPQQFALMNGELGFNHVGTAVVRSKPQGRPTKSGFSANHEYAVFWSQVEKPVLGRLPRKGSKAERYPCTDNKGIYSWANFRKSGTDSDRTDRKKSFYPIYVHGKDVRVPELKWNGETERWDTFEQLNSGEVAVWPIDRDGNEKVWTCSARRLRDEIADVNVISSKGGCIEIQKKYRPNQDGSLPEHGGKTRNTLPARVGPRY